MNENGKFHIDLAVPDKYEDDGEPISWGMESLMLFLSGMGTMALIIFVIWGASIFRGL